MLQKLNEPDLAEGPEDTIHQWFVDLLENHRDKDVADVLGITASKVWKLKKGHQRLSAVELLLLHEVLNVPLPKLGSRKPAVETTRTLRPTKVVGANDERRLFSLAYQRVNEIENKKPADLRAGKFEKLELVFHILRTIEETPEALDTGTDHD